MLPRLLPPTASPLPPRALARGLVNHPDAEERLRHTLLATLGLDKCYFASSGRTALYLLLRALRQDQPDDRCEVALPAYTCPSLVKVIQEADLAPRLIDLSPSTMAMDKNALSQAITERTLAVIVVHPFGLPQDVSRAMTVALARGAVVIEDVAQSMGARCGARSCGTLGHYGLFSLGPGKPLSLGGGGFICVNALGDEGPVERIWRQLPQQGPSANVLALARLIAFQAAFQPAGWWLAMKAGAQRVGEDEANWGFTRSRLTAVQATIAAQQLPHLEAYNRTRRAHADLLIDDLCSLPGLIIPPAAAEDTAIYLRLPLLFAQSDQCEMTQRTLQTAGYGAGRMYGRTLASIFPSLHGEFPGAEAVARGLLTLPTHHHLRASDLDRMAALVRAGLK